MVGDEWIDKRMDGKNDISRWVPHLNSRTNFAVLSTEGKTPVMKEKLNKSANCFKISFFRRNNNL